MAKNCPKCGAEFRDDIILCSDCHVPLVQQVANIRIPLDFEPREKIVNAVKQRYVDIYTVSDGLVEYGKALKIIGGVGCALLVIFGLYELVHSHFEIGLASVIFGAVWGIGCFISGLVLSALGQLARCIVDTSVNTTSLVDSEEKAAVMGLRL